MNNPLVSVIVPVYNAAPWLERCVESLLGQSLSDVEIILVDDGSGDESATLCRKYVRIASGNVLFIQNRTNQGLGASRNTGLVAASGRYIGFVDADDYVKPDMYANLVNTAEQTGADVILGGVEVHTGSVLDVQLPPDVKGLHDIVRYPFSFYGIWKNLYRAEAVRAANIRFPLWHFGEDVCFLFMLLASGAKVNSCPVPSYVYEKHETGITGNISRAADVLKNTAQMYSFLKERGLISKYQKEYSYIRYMLTIRNPSGQFWRHFVRKKDWKTWNLYMQFLYSMLKERVRGRI